MIIKHSMFREPWCIHLRRFLNRGLIEALREDGLDRSLLTWHITRQFEYPWILHAAYPQGRLLDIGHNLQFVCAMLGMGVRNITAHSTYQDAGGLGRIFPWLDNGGFSAAKCFEKYRKDLTLVLGMLDDLSFLSDESFDTIYCVSVIEHLPPDEVESLFNGMWRLLRRGGRLAVTCDWYVYQPVGGGKEKYVTNHDLGPRLSRLWAVPEQPLSEIPWSPTFDPKSWADPDSVLIEWGGDTLGVYGFTVTKP